MLSRLLRGVLAALVVFAVQPLISPSSAVAAIPGSYYSHGIWGMRYGGFGRPGATAVDAAGSVYVADTEHDRVLKLDSSGQVLAAWGSYGTGEGLFNYPEGIAVAPDGRVIVADTNNHRVQVFDASGIFLTQWTAAGGVNLNYPTGVAVDASNIAYVTDRGNSRVIKYTIAGAATVIGSPGNQPGQFSGPRGIAVDATYMYVADTGNSRMQRLTLTGSSPIEWGPVLVPDNTRSRYTNLQGVARRLDGSLVVVAAGGIWNDPHNESLGRYYVERCSITGSVLDRWGTLGTGLGQYTGIAGVAAGSGNLMYVADAGNNRIQALNASGVATAQWTGAGTGEGEYDAPRGVTQGPDGLVYVADSANHRIQVLTAAGAFVRQWGGLSTPTDLAFDSSGTLWVVEQGASRVSGFTSEGSPAGTIGSGSLTTPQGVAVDAAGDIWVADTGGARLVKFSSAGTLLQTIKPAAGASGELFAPMDVALDGSGRVWTVDSQNSHRVVVFSAAGVYDFAFGSYGTGTGQFVQPTGIAIGASGQVYVSDTGNHRVQRFTSTGLHESTIGQRSRPLGPGSVVLGGAGLGELRSPGRPAVLSDGRLLVPERGNHRLQPFSYDGTAPVSSATVVPSSWTNQVPVIVTISASDVGGSGVAATYYRIGNTGGYTLYEGPVGVSVNGDTPVWFYSVDKVGNEESPRKTVRTKIDTISPSGTFALDGGAAYTTTVTVTANSSVTDNNSMYPGEGMRFSTGSGYGPWMWYAATHQLTLSGEGVRSVSAQYKDFVGNILTLSDSITVDWTPPVTLAPALTGEWVTETVTVELQATDNVAGVADTFYRLGGEGAFATYDGPFEITDEGETFVQWYSVDHAGNTETTRTATARIDTVPPVGSFTLADGEAYIATVTAEAVSEFDDAVQMRFDVGGGYGGWVTFDTTTSVELPGAGPRTVRAQYADWLGNVSTHEASVTVDLAPPVTVAKNVPAVWVATPVTVTLEADDDHSGVAATHYRIGEDDEFAVYSDPFEVDREGETIVYFRSVDNVGNGEATGTATVRIDMTLPNGTMQLAAGEEYSTTSTVPVHSSVKGATRLRTDISDGYGEWSSYDATTTVELDQGEREVWVQYRDEVDDPERWLTLSDTITVDWEPPVTLAPVLAGEWETGTITVSLEATDNVSGVAETYYRLGGEGAFELYRDPFDITAEGETLVEWFSIDHAGNVEDMDSATARIDLPPGAPGGLRATSIGRDWAELEWEPLALGDIASYTLWRATSPDGPWTALGQVVPPEAVMRVEGLEQDVGYLFRVTARDVLGSTGPPSEPLAVSPGIALSRVAGSNRYRTALEVSSAYFETADDVVLATGEAFADALGASSLAGALEAPVLITESGRLSSGVLDEITRLGAKRVVIAGGTRAIAPAVEQALRAAGLEAVRFGGENRYETAALLAEETLRVRRDAPGAGAVLIVRGDEFADALSVAPVAYAGRIPVLMVRTDALPGTTAAAVADGGFDRAIVVGGTAAVSDQVADALGIASERVSGSNRYATAAAFALWADGEALASFSEVGLATGRAFPDALAGGAALGSRGGVVLLTTPDVLAPAARDALVARADRIERVAVLGGERAVESAVLEQVAEAIR